MLDNRGAGTSAVNDWFAWQPRTTLECRRRVCPDHPPRHPCPRSCQVGRYCKHKIKATRSAPGAAVVW